MKNYDERIESILRKYDERLAKEKRRKALILRSCAVGVGAAAVLGIGLTTYILKPPKKPAPSQSGIIVETETTSAETTVAPTSPSTTAPKTTATKQMTTTATSTTASISSASQTVTTVSMTQSTIPVTAASVSTSFVQTQIQSTTTTIESGYTTTTLTTTENGLSGRIPPDGPKSEYEIMLEDNFSNLELMKGFSYSVDCYYAEDAQVGEYLFELQLKPTVQTDLLPPSITAKVYEFKNSVHEYQLIVKFEGSEKNYPYVNFDYLRQIINNTEKEESL